MNFLRLVDLHESSFCSRCMSLLIRLQWTTVMMNRTQFITTWTPTGNRKNKKCAFHCCRSAREKKNAKKNSKLAPLHQTIHVGPRHYLSMLLVKHSKTEYIVERRKTNKPSKKHPYSARAGFHSFGNGLNFSANNVKIIQSNGTPKPYKV